MREIKYPKYKKFVDQRVEANNAMMALLAGSQLALHTLQLTEGSTQTLKNVFPAVNHIKRFDLSTSDARELLRDVEYHLASVAIPYALATHEAYVIDLLDDLSNWGYPIPPGRTNASNMHEKVFQALGAPPPTVELETFHLLRLTRNGIIHHQGEARPSLIQNINGLSADATQRWEERNQGNLPTTLISSSGRLNLTAETAFTTFASSKELGRKINQALRNYLREEIWVKIIVEGFGKESSRTKNSARWKSGLLGYMNFNYGLSIPVETLVQEAISQGLWSRSIF